MSVMTELWAGVMIWDVFQASWSLIVRKLFPCQISELGRLDG